MMAGPLDQSHNDNCKFEGFPERCLRNPGPQMLSCAAEASYFARGGSALKLRLKNIYICVHMLLEKNIEALDIPSR